MWEYDEYHCYMCGHIRKFTADYYDDPDIWCQGCHEEMVKVKEVRKDNGKPN